MHSIGGTSEATRWAVVWVYSKNGKRKLFRKDFREDFTGALELYVKAKIAAKPAATLLCVNMATPPPEELLPHVIRKRGRSKRTGKTKTVTIEVDRMKELNMQGKLYCPYCRELRPFVKKKGFYVGTVWVPETRYVCPICGISHNNHFVRVFNPTASIHMESSLAARTRKPRKSPRRRR